MKSAFFAVVLVMGVSINSAAAETTDISHGKISKMVPAKKEIYVMTDTGKKEYYFKDTTTVEKAGEKLSYNELSEGMEVTVTANKVGKRLDPIKVEILTDGEAPQ